MRRIVVTLLGLAAAGCFPKETFEPTPPRVDKSWANEERAIVSKATPMDEEREPRAEYGTGAERERAPLASLDGKRRAGLGDVVVRLKEGRYVLRSKVTMEPTALVLEGAGAHRTRLELDTETARSLTVRGARKVEIRGLTVVGGTGGGVVLAGCTDVKVEETCFVGARVGLALEGSTAEVASSVFAGCQEGLSVRDAEARVRETAFFRCWQAVTGHDATLDVSASVFVENDKVFDLRLDQRARLEGNLIFGRKQDLAWEGRPRLAVHNLTHERHLDDRLGRYTNRHLLSLDDFPDNVTWPERFDIAGVHLALERQRRRGEADPPEALKGLRRERAETMARASQKALRAGNLPAAQRLAEIALRYWGKSLKGAPEVLLDVADLAPGSIK